MNITQGLLNSMVVQRTKKGVSEARFEGTCGAKGRVVARATKNGKPVAAFAAREAGRAWGIYLRFERLDVSREQLRSAPEQVVLPRLVEIE